MFDEERADMTANVRFRSMRTLVTSFLMILIALGLFVMHWRWLRRQSTAG
jgi:HAMP domain-containing protein